MSFYLYVLSLNSMINDRTKLPKEQKGTICDVISYGKEIFKRSPKKVCANKTPK